MRLGYRRNQLDGTWSVLHAGTLRRIGLADDYQAADGVKVLSFDQAVRRARLEVFGADEADNENAERVPTLAAAIDDYERDLIARGGGTKNATWLRRRVPKHLLDKALASITAKDFRAWRDGIIAEGKVTAGTVNRLRACAFAALNNARRLDPRISDVWSTGWPVVPGGRRARNIVLTADGIRALVREAHEIDPAFGLWCEMAAVTGARPSQLAGLTCGDVQDDRVDDAVEQEGQQGSSRDRTKASASPASARDAATSHR